MNQERQPWKEALLDVCDRELTLPSIALVTPSLNQGEFLERAMRSVLEQDYPALDYVVMDGGSADSSVDIIRRYADQLHDWVSGSDAGQSAAINAGFAKSSALIMGWLNADDRLLPGALHAVGRYFAQHPDSQWLAGRGLIEERRHGLAVRSEPCGPRALAFDLLCSDTEQTVPQPSVFWRRSLWNQVGGLDESLHLAMDFDLWLKFSQVSEGHLLSDVLSVALNHPRMKTRQFDAESFVEVSFVLDRHGRGDLARQRLVRVVRRAFDVDRRLAWITRNPFYRRWRENREKRRRTVT